MKSRIVSAVVAGMLMGALVAPAQAQPARPGEPVALPEVQNLETTTPAYDPLKGIALGIEGLYQRTVAGTDGRTAKIYASKDAYLGAYVTVLNTPEGEDTVKWLVKSGWLERADKQKLVLYVLEPGASGKWGTPAAEASYIETAFYDFANSRGNYYQPSESYYVVGYDTPGSVLQQVVMKDPIGVAAAAFVDASRIDGSFLPTLDTNFYPTTDWNGRQVTKSQVPTPVWIINSKANRASDAVIDYWKDVNEVGRRAESYQGGKRWTQRDNTLYGFVAASSRTSVAVLEDRHVRQPTGYQGRSARASLEDKIYGFLDDYTRYGGNVGGNTIGSRPDYAKLGVRYDSFVVDGRLREYLVYVPKKAKEAARRGKDVPAVFSLHGSGMTMYMMFDYSRWWEVADREGFILVTPTSTNNQRATSWATAATSSDHTFIATLLDKIKSRYNVDSSRVYLNGQSNGSAMTQALGRNLAISKNFTAIGSTSFPSSTTVYDGETLPFYTLWGEFDFWPWQRDAPQVNGMLTYWINRNKALGTPTEPATETRQYRRTNWSWKNAAGVEVVKYGVTWGRGHSIIPEEMPVLYDWLKKWKKNAAGENVYVGR